jgi:hypothetical protein
MQIIRDNELGRIMMIPLFQRYGITRCNVKGCKEEHTTICIHPEATFGLCEKHYKEGEQSGTLTLELEFN